MREAAEQYCGGQFRWQLLTLAEAAAVAEMTPAQFVISVQQGKMPKAAREWVRDDAARRWLRKLSWRRGDILRAMAVQSEKRLQLMKLAGVPPA